MTRLIVAEAVVAFLGEGAVFVLFVRRKPRHLYGVYARYNLRTVAGLGQLPSTKRRYATIL